TRIHYSRPQRFPPTPKAVTPPATSDLFSNILISDACVARVGVGVFSAVKYSPISRHIIFLKFVLAGHFIISYIGSVNRFHFK
ncbi:hypothetical protein DRQ36_04965, partial [bacterium]